VSAIITPAGGVWRASISFAEPSFFITFLSSVLEGTVPNTLRVVYAERFESVTASAVSTTETRPQCGTAGRRDLPQRGSTGADTLNTSPSLYAIVRS
jgi:hypothetical protein